MSEEYLSHHGIKGMRWGIRRFQNEDGTLTAEGKNRYDREGIVSRQKNTPPKHAKVDGYEKKERPRGMIVKGGEPRTRWGRGKRISDEMYKIQLKKEEDYKKNSKEHQANKREIERLEKKYGLNKNLSDDERNEYQGMFSKKERKMAESRYWNKIQDQVALEDRFTEKAASHARKTIEEKYGSKGLSDVKHYNNVNAVAALGTLGAISLAVIFSHSKKK